MIFAFVLFELPPKLYLAILPGHLIEISSYLAVIDLWLIDFLPMMIIFFKQFLFETLRNENQKSYDSSPGLRDSP